MPCTKDCEAYFAILVKIWMKSNGADVREPGRLVWVVFQVDAEFEEAAGIHGILRSDEVDVDIVNIANVDENAGDAVAVSVSAHISDVPHDACGVLDARHGMANATRR